MLRLISLGMSLLALAGCSEVGRFVIRLSEGEIQERVDKKFPRKVKKLVFELRLESPRVALNPDTDRMEITFRVTGLVANLPVGHALSTVSGGVRYDPHRAEFNLTDPRIIRFDASHLPGKYLESTRSTVDTFVDKILPAVTLHRLDESKQSIEKALLKRAWVCDEMLCLEMGI